MYGSSQLFCSAANTAHLLQKHRSRRWAHRPGIADVSWFIPRRSRDNESRSRTSWLAWTSAFPTQGPQIDLLFMNGAPSQIDLWDYKPRLSELFDTDLPESIRNGQRLTTMTSGQKRFPIAPTIYKFAPHGKCGTMVSELLPPYCAGGGRSGGDPKRLYRGH